MQVGEIAQFFRDAARQLVVAEVQPLQLGEVAQFFRDRPRQLIFVEVQPLQVGEIAQFFRDAARQSFVVEVHWEAQAGHPTGLDGDALPLSDEQLCTPVE